MAALPTSPTARHDTRVAPDVPRPPVCTPSREHGQALLVHRDGLTAALARHRLARHPALALRPGPDGEPDCEEDARRHLSFLRQALQAGRPEIFADAVAWTKVTLASRGVPAEALARHLRLLRELLLECLPPQAAAAAAAVVDEALAGLPQMPLTVPTFLDPAAPLAALARDHLALLLRGERATAGQRILAAVAAGTPIRLIYLEVFQRTQREIGRLWQLDRISVAQEHYCSAATQLIMSQLYPHVFDAHAGDPGPGQRRPGTLVATCVAGDLHEIGVRMLADLFEMAGWNAYYLGGDTPTAAVLQTLHERQADVLAVSATLAFHVAAVQDLVARVRADARLALVRVLVGGPPFNLAPGLWREIGADGHARSADEAIAVAQGWVGAP